MAMPEDKINGSSHGKNKPDVETIKKVEVLLYLPQKTQKRFRLRRISKRFANISYQKEDGETEMKKIIITTQDEFDKIRRINADEEVIFESNDIEINCILKVYGVLHLKGNIQSSWDNKFIQTRDSSQAHIVTRESSHAHIVTRESSQVKKLLLFGFSIVTIPFDFKFPFKKSKTAKIQRYKFKDLKKYLEVIEEKKGGER